jgi:hypothetical protein
MAWGSTGQVGEEKYPAERRENMRAACAPTEQAALVRPREKFLAAEHVGCWRHDTGQVCWLDGYLQIGRDAWAEGNPATPFRRSD